MTGAEKRWLWWVAFLLLGFTTLPYLLGFWQQGSEWKFSGFFIGVEDGNSYIAKMVSGAQGNWLFKTPYTAYPQSGFLTFLPYILLGKLTSPPGQHAQLVALFQIFRWVGGFVMIYATYRFVSYLIENVRLRQLTTLLILLGGGLGWLALFGLRHLWSTGLPLEFYSPETFGFLSLFTLPHLAMARGLLLLGVVAFWQGYQRPVSNLNMGFNGLLWILLGLMQPLTVLVGWMVLGIDGLIRIFGPKQMGLRRWLRDRGTLNALVMVILSAPMVMYTVYSFLSDGFLKIWASQNIIKSPPPGDYVLAYGLLMPLVMVGAWKIWKVRKIEELVLCAWILILPALAYFPNNLQRRLPEGSWVAIGTVAMIGYSSLSPKKIRGATAILTISCISSLSLFVGSLTSVLQTSTPVFDPSDSVNSFLFLGEKVNDYPVVLAAYHTSNALAAWAPVRTLIGHGPESVHLPQVQKEVENMYSTSATDRERTDLLIKYGVRYMLWGPEERELGTWNPGDWPLLRQIYHNETVEIFEVTSP